MALVDEIMDLENGEGSMEEQYATMQKLINSGQGWHFQGSYGRAMMDAIKSGYCMCGKEARKDNWGNMVPSRTDLKPGSFGTYAFVAQHMGEEWADKMAEVE